jgi:hypothetical protein
MDAVLLHAFVLAEANPETFGGLLLLAIEKGGAFAVGCLFIGVPLALLFLKVIRPDMKEESAKRDVRAAVERETAIANAAAASSLKEASEGLQEVANRLALTQEMANETLEQARQLVRQATEIRTHKAD